MQIILFLSLFYGIFFSVLTGQQEHSIDSSKARSGFAYIPILYYTPETKLAFGAGTLYVSRSTQYERPSSFTATLVYTTNKQFIGELSTNLFFRQNTLWHSGSFYFEKFPNTFYGIGNSTPDSLTEKFTEQVTRINPSLLWKIANHFYCGPTIHYESWSLQKTESGKALSVGTIAGSKTTTVSAIGLLMNYDERDNYFAATNGRFYQIAFIASPQVLGSTLTFTRTKIDLREYFPLGNSHIISAQVLFHTTTGAVPFRFMPRLGGQNILRGYFEGRFIDKHMTALQTEYRSPYLYRFGFVLFGGIGEVSNRLTSFSLSGVKLSYGAGLRFAFIPDEHIILRIDYGMGYKSNGVYITMNEAI